MDAIQIVLLAVFGPMLSVYFALYALHVWQKRRLTLRSRKAYIGLALVSVIWPWGVVKFFQSLDYKRE